MRLLSAIYFREPISVPDWRSSKVRKYVLAEEAEIKLDLDARIVVLVPKGVGSKHSAPLENATNWTDRDDPKPPAKPKAA